MYYLGQTFSKCNREDGARLRLSCRQFCRSVALALITCLSCIPGYAQKGRVTEKEFGALTDQYFHTGWTENEGAPAKTNALAQTADGYLWLGTPTGLIRFDGVKFERFAPPLHPKLPFHDVSALKAAADGGLWIGYRTGGASFVKDDRIQSYSEADGMPSAQVIGFAIGSQGVVWASTSAGLVRFEAGRWVRIGKEWGLSSPITREILFDRQGWLWVSTGDGVACLPPSSKHFWSRQIWDDYDLIETPDGAVWMIHGAKWQRLGAKWRREEMILEPVPAQDGTLPKKSGPQRRASEARFDLSYLAASDGSIWTGVRTGGADGVTRIPSQGWLTGRKRLPLPGQLLRTTRAQGLTGSEVQHLLQDREGDVWVATLSGLDRFRQKNVFRAKLPAEETDHSPALLTIANGELLEGFQGKDEQAIISVQNDTHKLVGKTRSVNSFFQDTKGVIWIGGYGTLTRYAGGKFVEVPLPTLPGPKPHWKVQAIGGDLDGALWLSIIQNGTYRLRNGAWEKFGGLKDLPQLTAITLWSTPGGQVWFGYTVNRIALVEGDKVRNFTSTDGLAVGNVLAISGLGKHLWVGGQSGLEVFDGNRFRMMAVEADGNFSGISGIVETGNGDLWLNQATGIAHITAEEIAKKLRDPAYTLQYELFDHLDGLRGTATQLNPLPSAALGTDGRIWVAGTAGVWWIDPARIHKNPLPPPVSIQSIASDGRIFPLATEINLPPLPANVQIDYTALSLSIPERVRFRYRLEGVDKQWQDAGTRRTAFYTRLGPRTYTFHVIACNNDGVWNEAGATMVFRVAPTFYETWWFQGLSLAALGGLIWLMYLYRLSQVTAQVRERLGARMEERERIARELHDTLLQGFQGLMLRFQAVMKALPERGKAHEMMEQALDRADEVLLEGRQRVRELRVEHMTGNGLPDILTKAGEELAQDYPIPFRLTIVGVPSVLDPTVCNEVFRIGREAMVNAFQHSKASTIEAELTYHRTGLHLVIRDNGRGMEQKILSDGVTGHWGLSGMRERAEKIGGDLHIWSQAGAGTEIQLRIPGKVAYPHAGKPSLWGKLHRMRRNGEAESL